MKTLTNIIGKKTNYRYFFSAIIFLFFVTNSQAQLDPDCVILTNCPQDIVVCADTNLNGDPGPPFDGANVNWTAPTVGQTCSGGNGTDTFEMLFELNEQL